MTLEPVHFTDKMIKNLKPADKEYGSAKVEGNKNPDARRPLAIGRLFKQTGLRVLYAFLCSPGMEN
ncbi:MAG: hypothetical protein A2075_03885 [Geobacteraceae bacterium GWC2_58_44]|nr:MAG: hypothetical protein A2075_03885 [Geobacteraceae bacterium GWC2_58_44]HBG07536.1 hypothetical protein [Geobacter sp.]